MVYPWRLSWRLGSYLLKNRLRGHKPFPLVLMLEPLFRCNLTCSGCGRIREYGEYVDRMLSAEECLAAVAEAGAPVVCLTGGEPLLHPQIAEIASALVAKKYFVFFSTNGLLLRSKLDQFKPSPYLGFVIHLDGLAASHDQIVERKGAFDTVIEAIREAKKAGFRVHTNTTIYKGTDPDEIKELFDLLAKLKIDGVIVSPAFSYDAVNSDVFLSRAEIHQVFVNLLQALDHRVKLFNTPLYFQFLSGKRSLQCTPWANPTRNPLGWKSPCYWVTDHHYPSFEQLIQQTPWQQYGVGRDPRCANCMTHGGFEAGAILNTRGLSDLWQMLKWNFFS